ncbi:MAG TPA: cupin domain-containing protein [bacterium]|nr:cupin domain-containing protein [bacterium]
MKAIWLETGKNISAEELNTQGVTYRQLPTEEAAYTPPLQSIMKDNGYVTMDQVKMWAEMPNFQALCDKFVGEHLHTDDEVRFVLAGSGVFEIRSQDDRWMKIIVEPQDFISVPANRYHRFYLTDEKKIQCVRLFKDQSGWAPFYRKDREEAAAAK